MAILGPDIDDLRANGDVEGLIEALAWIGIGRGRQAAVALAKLGDPRAVQPLTWALGDAVQKQNVKAIITTAKALARFGDERAAEPLLQALESAFSLPEGKDKERMEVLASIGTALQGMGSASTKAVVGKLDHDEVAMRVLSVDILGEIGDAQAVEPLVLALQDGHPRVRLGAEEALAKMPDASLDGLIEALGAEDTTLREAAAEALAKIGDSRASEALMETDHGRQALERKSVRLAVTATEREYRFPDRCLYCGGPGEATRRFGLWVGQRVKLELPYCEKHRKEAKINAALLIASILFHIMLMVTVVLLVVFRGGLTGWDAVFVGLAGIGVWFGLVWLTRSFLSRYIPSMKDTSLSELTLGFEPSYASGVLTVAFTNLEIAREFERLNCLPKTRRGAGE